MKPRSRRPDRRDWHIDSNTCRRCEETFRYYRAKKPRIYCRPCRAKERRDAVRFHNATYYWIHKAAAQHENH